MQKEQNKPKRQKKPYHIKKADLDLTGYKKDLEDRSPGHLFQRAVTSLRISRQFHLYVLLQSVAAVCGYGQFMFCIGSSNACALGFPLILILAVDRNLVIYTGILWMCYANTGKRKDGEKSAYSIFNENTEAYDTTFIR